MLKDLPSYANRVIVRAQGNRKDPELLDYVIVAGRAEFTPLPLKQNQHTPLFPDTTQQIFFTTLERHYWSGQIVNTQNYHWVFLTQTESGWRLVMMYSQFGSSSSKGFPTPPQESTNGAIGQAIRLWLRDCQM
jgi:hypothetical protein